MKQKVNKGVSFHRELKKQLFYHNKTAFIITVAATIAVSLLNLVISWEMQQIIDCISGNTTLSLVQIALCCLGTLAAFVLVSIVLYFSDSTFMRRAMQQYKKYAFEKLLKKSIHDFNKEDSSVYLSALTNDATSIETNYLKKIFSLIQQIILFVGAFSLMLWYSPKLTLVAFLLSSLPLIVSLLTGNRLAKQEESVSEQNAGFMGMVKEALSGFAVIKSFQSGQEILKLFSDKNVQTEWAKCKRTRTETLIQTIGLVAGIVAQFGVFLFGAYLALSGESVTAGTTIVFVQLMNFVINPIAVIPQILANRKASIALMDKLGQLLAEDEAAKAAVNAPHLNNALSVQNLSFSYDEGNPVLQNITTSFEAGKSYAIVGGSGSGKSTLLQLLMGSLPSYSGSICYDDAELSDISSEALYQLVSIIQQNVFVFQSSIRNNITMFKDFPPKKLANAISMAGLDSLIEEHGEDYNCGEAGNGLSGGERQRISIARSLLRETPVLFVDEATAALDAATSFAVSNAILDIPGLTRLVVTHRLEESLLQRYDQILVMRNGEIAEAGSFVELMEKKGYFYSLFTVAQ